MSSRRYPACTYLPESTYLIPADFRLSDWREEVESAAVLRGTLPCLFSGTFTYLGTRKGTWRALTKPPNARNVRPKVRLTFTDPYVSMLSLHQFEHRRH